jgi:hypothetical protein
MTTPGADYLDTASLFGLRVRSREGQSLGVIVAVIHRGDGCDVLVERRRLWRRTVTRVDVDDLVASALGVLQQVPPSWRRDSAAGGSGDDAVA